jgi:L-ascorbate metabolism protein UlaG (beta-lactamase superfamily)
MTIDFDPKRSVNSSSNPVAMPTLDLATAGPTSVVVTREASMTFELGRGMSNIVRALCALVTAAVGTAVAPAVALAVCLPVAQAPRFIPASFGPRSAQADVQVRLTFVGHASFLIESPSGVRAVTDYNGVHRPPVVPDIVTMNNAHSTHFTDRPDPRIAHVLRGWWEPGRDPVHDLTVGDIRVRNVTTNVRDWSGGTREHGNSIFIFEVGDICIAHLGHLHHELTEAHLDIIGRIDVLLVPVDGGFTMGQEFMADVIAQIRPSLIVPMHWFGQSRLDRFLAMMQDTYPSSVNDGPSITLSRATMPWRRTIVLPGPM